MSTSHYASRPAQNDVGSDTLRVNHRVAPNTRRRTRATQLAWLAVGVALLITDGTAVFHFANSPLEATIIALLTMPTGILVILAAMEVRK